MHLRERYINELDNVNKRINNVSHKIAINDNRMGRISDPEGFLASYGLSLGAELARYQDRKRELEHYLEEKM